MGISARLQVAGASLTVDSAEALVRKPDGSQVTLALNAQGDVYSADYQPDQPGLHSVEVRLTGKNADGFSIDRAAFLTFEVQPGSAQVDNLRLLVVAGLAGLMVVLIGLLWLLRRSRREEPLIQSRDEVLTNGG